MTDEARLGYLLQLRRQVTQEISRVEQRIAAAADPPARRRRQRRRRAECGTDGGYYRHLRTTHTRPCAACRAAHAVVTHVRLLRKKEVA